MVVFLEWTLHIKLVGHLKRCFNLAKIFKGYKIVFISKKYEGNLNHLIIKINISFLKLIQKNISIFKKLKKLLKNLNKIKLW